jgi:hypothetical protein
VIGCFLILLAIFLGNFNIGYRFLLNPYFRTIGKLTYEAGLLYPIVIMLYYGRTQAGLYMTTADVICMGTGNIISNLFTGFFLYMIIEYPLKRLIDISISSKISHDAVVLTYLQ